MHRPSSRLLITLVLLSVAATAAWTTAQARPSSGARWVRSHVSTSVVIGSRPGMRPASGEPDVGATKNPPLISGRSGIIDEEPADDPGSGSGSWLSRIGMIWVARYLGAS
jgi:hypothetical protein